MAGGENAKHGFEVVDRLVGQRSFSSADARQHFDRLGHLQKPVQDRSGDGCSDEGVEQRTETVRRARLLVAQNDVQPGVDHATATHAAFIEAVLDPTALTDVGGGLVRAVGAHRIVEAGVSAQTAVIATEGAGVLRGQSPVVATGANGALVPVSHGWASGSAMRADLGPDGTAVDAKHPALPFPSAGLGPPAALAHHHRPVPTDATQVRIAVPRPADDRPDPAAATAGAHRARVAVDAAGLALVVATDCGRPAAGAW